MSAISDEEKIIRDLIKDVRIKFKNFTEAIPMVISEYIKNGEGIYIGDVEATINLLIAEIQFKIMKYKGNSELLTKTFNAVKAIMSIATMIAAAIWANSSTVEVNWSFYILLLAAIAVLVGILTIIHIIASCWCEKELRYYNYILEICYVIKKALEQNPQVLKS